MNGMITTAEPKRVSICEGSDGLTGKQRKWYCKKYFMISAVKIKPEDV